MKTMLFSLMALVCSMSINAQVLKIYNNKTLVATYKATEANAFVFEEEPSTTTAKRNGNIDVNCVRLWYKGPMFAEYNVGAANNKAEDYGGYYAWGGSQDKVDDHNTGSEVLTGDNDTATKLWGNNWRMPTYEEFKALIENCDQEWTTVNGIPGRKFTGRGIYSYNSVFFPASGFYDFLYSKIMHINSYGKYWTSTDEDLITAYDLTFYQYDLREDFDLRDCGFSVRAVLKED